ncbi:MAG: hypothetical protein LEGION0403_FIIPPAGN_02197 [Legionella sp.]|uniref:Dot/Icm T4SS effector Wip n=1 Tax=Legionella sp. TaxID=459 RepID=UPI003D0A68CD
MNEPLIKTKVDIYQCPDVDNQHNLGKNKNITIGDLHGNAIKLIFFLVKQGVATIEKHDYARLVTVYQIPVEELTKEDLNEFSTIIHDKMKIINNEANVRLIGDEFCDRGMGDHYTLWVLDKLHEAKVPLEILYSNHGGDFITYTELVGIKAIDFEGYDFSLGDSNQMQSLTHMDALITKDLLSLDKIMEIVQRAYKPTLKVFAYELSADGKKLSFYSHAPIDMSHVEQVAKQLNIPYDASTARKLAETIDSINKKFQEYVNKKQTNEIAASGTALNAVAWNDNQSTLDRSATRSGYDITFTHGHRSGTVDQDNVYNLDTDLGKNIKMNEREYAITYSFGFSLEYTRKTQLLQDKCSVYKNHLTNEIKKLASSLPNELLTQHYLKDGKPDIDKIADQVSQGISLTCTSEGVGNDDVHSSERYPKLYAAVHKYNTVRNMINALGDDKAPDPIADMKKIMMDNNDQLVAHRSHRAIRFFQDILNILSLGTYSKATKNTFAFWKSRGEALVDDIEQNTSSVNPK